MPSVPDQACPPWVHALTDPVLRDLAADAFQARAFTVRRGAAEDESTMELVATGDEELKRAADPTKPIHARLRASDRAEALFMKSAELARGRRNVALIQSRPELERVFHVERNSGRIYDSVHAVLRATVDHFGLRLEELTSRSITGEAKRAKEVAAFLCRTHTGQSFPELGNVLGVHYSWVISARDKVRASLARGEHQVVAAVGSVERRLRQ